jgi:hypothetical protein
MRRRSGSCASAELYLKGSFQRKHLILAETNGHTAQARILLVDE